MDNKELFNKILLNYAMVLHENCVDRDTCDGCPLYDRTYYCVIGNARPDKWYLEEE